MNGMKHLGAILSIIRWARVAAPSAANGFAMDTFSYRFDENGTRYYLRVKGDHSPGGVFDGAVLALAWNKNVILAQVDRLYNGDSDGLYVIDLKTNSVRGL